MPFEIVRNDITKMHVDAIVNPTNSTLFGTAGVDGAIHKIEGPRLQEETSKIGTLAPGKCALSKAYKLPANYIIHTVGPIWKDGSSVEVDILRSCYKNSLLLAKEKGVETIAFPLISSGSYGCPKDVALNIAVRSIGEFLLFNEMTVYLVVFDKKTYQLSEDLFSSVEAYIDDNYIDDNYINDNYINDNYINDNYSDDNYREERLFQSRSRVMAQEDSVFYKELHSESMSIEKSEKARPKKKSLDDIIKHLDETFSEMLIRLIDEKGFKDPEVYKKANVTKQTFSKIKNNRAYNPTKQTVIAFAIALQLSLDEAKDLLLKSGYALSNSNRFDVIISYFLESKKYDIYEINAVLFAYDENLLGIQ